MGKNNLGIYCDTSSIIILLLSNIFTLFFSKFTFCDTQFFWLFSNFDINCKFKPAASSVAQSVDITTLIL